jgi:hypothetical protein
MNEIKEFFIKFFTSIKCSIESKEDTMIISNVPQNFEKFSGKKGPYYLSFLEAREGYELVSQNHFLIRAIKDFLEGRGEITLLKLNPRIDFTEELPKIIPFKNSKIKSISTQTKNDFIFKFSFSTSFQYLNERENIITNLYVRNGKLVEFDESVSLTEGNKKEIGEINLENEYVFVKEKLKEFTAPKISELSAKLNLRLKEEISRIKNHYENNLKEFTEQEEGIKKQINANKDNSEKIKKLEKTLQTLRESKNVEKLKEEEKILIKNETKKHGLSVNSKLINTAIIYFPVSKLSLILELANKNNKIIEIAYDSLKKQISPLFCQSCKSQLNEIIICSSGHLTCRNCGGRCNTCGEVLCKNCVEKKCSSCGKHVCPSCMNTCSKCHKIFCEKHMSNETKRKICQSCTIICSECGVAVDPELMTNISGKIFCPKCSNKKIKSEICKR